MSLEDQGFMAKALRLGENGRYSAHPNPCVGCVLVRRGKVVGEGFHMLAGHGHAEANALASASHSSRVAFMAEHHHVHTRWSMRA
jgi:diaminohydroxyphosphoribosylaminopyrimidine deaminase/5-amino-6-(5-phosphoribosylamino)uracil reductase